MWGATLYDSFFKLWLDLIGTANSQLDKANQRFSPLHQFKALPVKPFSEVVAMKGSFNIKPNDQKLSVLRRHNHSYLNGILKF